MTADENNNVDLFWALRGGGGGTFGVVTSIVVRAHPQISATSLSFTFTSTNVTDETYFAGVKLYWESFIEYTNAGTYGYFYMSVGSTGIYTFQMLSWFAPNMTQRELADLAAPFLNNLAELGIEFTVGPSYTTATASTASGTPSSRSKPGARPPSGPAAASTPERSGTTPPSSTQPGRRPGPSTTVRWAPRPCSASTSRPAWENTLTMRSARTGATPWATLCSTRRGT